MFFFCSIQDLHKQLIHRAYEDCISLANAFRNKHPKYDGYNLMVGGTQVVPEDEVTEYHNTMKEKKRILIRHLFLYCELYPDEPVSHHRYIAEYKDYPWRLEQNIGNVLLQL